MSVLRPLGLPMLVIHGNNSGGRYSMKRMAVHPDSVISYRGQNVGAATEFALGDLAEMQFEILAIPETTTA